MLAVSLLHFRAAPLSGAGTADKSPDQGVWHQLALDQAERSLQCCMQVACNIEDAPLSGAGTADRCGV